MRVVSVLPSATEIVHALGAGPELVGRSAECDYPDAVRSLPIVMAPKTWDPERSSAEIDARVRGQRREDGSLYAIDLPRLAALRPDLLLTQDLCRVCSVTDEEARAACELAGVSPTILSISPRSLEEVWSSVATIGAALGRPDQGRELADVLRAGTPPSAPGGGKRVLVLEWIDPLIEAGLWTPDLIRSSGGQPWSTEVNGVAHGISMNRLESDPPDLLVISPCSFLVARTLRELRENPIGRALGRLRVPSGTWIADEAHFSRPGPRLVEGRDLVARLLAGRPPSGRLPVEPWGRPTLAIGS